MGDPAHGRFAADVELHDRFEGVDEIACASLVSWATDGSRFVPDELCFALVDAAVENQLSLNAEGYEGSLRVGETYQAQPDEAAAKRGFVRVFDDTAEDYLFLATRFRSMWPPRTVSASGDGAAQARGERAVASPVQRMRR